MEYTDLMNRVGFFLVFGGGFTLFAVVLNIVFERTLFKEVLREEELRNGRILR